MRQRRISWLCFAAACMLLVGAVSPMLAAQPASNGNVNLELKDTDVKSAIEVLFRNTGKNYSIDSSVQGTISALSIQDVPFDSALRSLTKSAGLIYRVDGGVYIISAKPVSTVVMPDIATPVPDSGVDFVTTEPEVRVEKISLNNVSATEILSILAGTENRSYGGMGYGMGNGMGYGSPYGMRGGMGYGMGNGMGNGMGYGNMGYGSGYGRYGSGYGSQNGYGMGTGYGSGMTYGVGSRYGGYGGSGSGYSPGVYSRGW